MVEPIEITEKEIIRRPPNLPLVAPGVGSPVGKAKPWIAEFKDMVQQAKEIKEMLSGMGLNINLPDIPKLKGVTGDKGNSQKQQGPQVSQFALLQRMLIAKYGDISLKELGRHLKEDFGDSKISDLGHML